MKNHPVFKIAGPKSLLLVLAEVVEVTLDYSHAPISKAPPSKYYINMEQHIISVSKFVKSNRKKKHMLIKLKLAL